MSWEVEYTDEFERWWDGLTEVEQDHLDKVVGVLMLEGPLLKEPYSKPIKASRHRPDMKELRIKSKGDDIRVLYAFDPRRMAILLIGGNKTGQWEEFYDTNIPIADDLFDEHLRTITKEQKR